MVLKPLRFRRDQVPLHQGGLIFKGDERPARIIGRQVTGVEFPGRGQPGDVVPVDLCQGGVFVAELVLRGRGGGGRRLMR